MAIEVTWHDEAHTILVWKLSNTWDWNTFHASHHRLNQMAEEETSEDVVFVIVDSRQGTSLPSNVVLNVQQAIENDLPKITTYVVVGMNLLMKTFYNTLVRGLLERHAKQNRLHVASTMDEALEYIDAHRKGS